MIIRNERPADIDAIRAITQAAFAPMPFSAGTEGAVIDGLRRDGDLSLSRVAEEGGQIIGHIALSPVSVAGERDGMFGLGPVCAVPGRQRSGIGTALIRDALDWLRAHEAKACFLVGDSAYYSRFGFVGECGLSHGSVPATAVQGLWLDGRARRGEIVYAPAFGR